VFGIAIESAVLPIDLQLLHWTIAMAPSASAPSSREKQSKQKHRHSMEDDKENATNAPTEDETMVEDEGAIGNETMEEEETTAARGTKRSSSSHLQPQQPGILKSIYCENFMCHRKLRVDLNRHVTFIHGQNGSGMCNVAFDTFIMLY
jgi:hypothetical protein